MLVRNIALTVGALFAIGLGCGGKAVIDGPNDNSGGAGGAGGSTNASSSNASSTANSSSSTGTPSCMGFTECCQERCDKGADLGLSCFTSCNCESGSFPQACEDALAAIYACVTAAEPFGQACSGANPILLCGSCDAEATAAEAACGFPQPCQ